MSGGHYDYAYLKVIEFGDCIERDLTEPKDWMNYSPECMLRLKQIAAEAARFAGVMKDVEWLLSGDVGEETFMKNFDPVHPGITKLIAKMKAQPPSLPPHMIESVWIMLEGLEPVSNSSSLHIHETVYHFAGYEYTALWEISQTSDVPFDITFRKLPE